MRGKTSLRFARRVCRPIALLEGLGPEWEIPKRQEWLCSSERWRECLPANWFPGMIISELGSASTRSGILEISKGDASGFRERVGIPRGVAGECFDGWKVADETNAWTLPNHGEFGTRRER